MVFLDQLIIAELAKKDCFHGAWRFIYTYTRSLGNQNRWLQESSNLSPEFHS